MNIVYYLIFRLFTFLFFLFPFWLLYCFSDLFYYLLFYIIRYRRKVVNSNLRKAFPTKTDDEICAISEQFYRYLSDIMIESLKGFTMSRNSIIKRHKIINPEILDKYYIQNRSIIGISGHYGNWEWGSMSGGLQVKHNAIAFYKKLSNKYIERLLKKSREKCGTQLASIKDTYETFQVNNERVCAYLMIADQSPSFDQLEKAYWLDFMGIDTAFLYGPEKYAKMYNLPVVYIDIKPIKRGYYELELFPITDNPNSLEDGELTKIFVQMLEKRIIDNPHYWVWSHRRWKRSREK